MIFGNIFTIIKINWNRIGDMNITNIIIKFSNISFNAVFKGYTKIVGTEAARKILDKIKEIHSRGRYIASEERFQA